MEIEARISEAEYYGFPPPPPHLNGLDLDRKHYLIYYWLWAELSADYWYATDTVVICGSYALDLISQKIYSKPGRGFLPENQGFQNFFKLVQYSINNQLT